MSKKLKRPIAFIATLAMVCSMLLYLPSGVMTDIGFGLAVSAEDATGTTSGEGNTPADTGTTGGTGETPDNTDGTGETPDNTDGTGETPDNTDGTGETPDNTDGTGETPDNTDSGEDSTDEPAAVESESVMLLAEGAADFTPSQPTAGDGSSTNPYQISNANELYWFAGLVNGTLDSVTQNTAAWAKLTANITVNNNVLVYGALNTTNSGSFTSWTPIGNYDNQYTGTFDGNGKTISGLYFDNGNTNYVGLFGYVGSGGNVSNVGIVDSYFNGKRSVGGVCGENYGTIKNCYNTGAVSGSSYVGGVCGRNEGVTITNCYSTGAVSGTVEYIGGVCGRNGSTIKNCYSTGAVSGNPNVGGVCGYNSGTIENCYSTGTVSAAGDYVGGVCGYNVGGTIKNCYSTGAVSGASVWVGGVCGRNEGGTIENCYNIGAVSGASGYVGGVCGYNYNGTIKNCYYDTDFYTGNAIGKSTGGETNVTGKTTADLCGSLDDLGFDSTVWTAGSYSAVGKKATATFPQPKVFENTSAPKTTILFYNFGTDEAPDWETYTEISTAEELQNIKNNLSGNYVLTTDITLTAPTTEGGSNWTPIGSGAGFTGKFSGDGHTISGIVIKTTSNYQGLLFGYSTGTIMNVGVIDSSISGKDYVGGVCGQNDGTITNCYSTGAVSGSWYVGGVCGRNKGTITNCYSTGAVSVTSDYVGGVCGENEGTITNCYSTGEVSGSDDVGGVCGINYNGTIKNCYYDTDFYTGNAIGSVWGTVTNVTGKTTAELFGSLPAGFDSAVWTAGSLTIDQADGKKATATLPQLKVFENTSAPKPNVSLYNFGTNGSDDWKPYTEISTAEELQNINLSGNYVLTADITLTAPATESDSNWTAIGTSSTKFTGKFDGNGHTISGIVINKSDEDYQGLFGYSTGTIMNVGVIDSSISGRYYVGGVCGRNEGGTITNCYSTGAVTGSGDHAGGVCGYNDNGTITNCYSTGVVNGTGYVGGVCGYNNSGTIENCYSTGAVSGTRSVGGVCGWNEINSTIKNCYSTGTVTGSVDHVGGVCGYNYGTITNCYYLKGTATGGINGTDDVANNVLVKTTTQFTFGEVAYLLWQGCTVNEVTYDGSVWGQTIGADNYPVLGGDKVYPCTKGCLAKYANTENAIGEHTATYSNDGFGTCADCGKEVYQPAELVDGVYQIGNAGQLYWFADKVNNDNENFGSVNAVLTKDIIVNKRDVANCNGNKQAGWMDWNPISYYAGTFDGDSKTISGLYFNNTDEDVVGLFRYISTGGTVKNVGVVNSYFNGHMNIGGVCGHNEGTIENCYNTGTVSGTENVGGVCGDNRGTIENCYNEGKISTSNYNTSGKFGGVCGDNNNEIKNCYNTGEVSGAYNVGGVCGDNKNEIKNCYNTGTVRGTHNYVGGVCGRNYDSCTIENCYNTGSVDGSNYVGCVCGQGDGTITNCYYLNITTSGDSNATAKDLNQFGSGEVAYLLQSGQTAVNGIIPEVWGQQIGTDKYPVLGGTKVYKTTPCVSYSNENVTEKEHTGAETDGICDVCGARTAYIVALTSQPDGVNASVAKLDGGGKINVGESTTIKAPAVPGYTFNGWFDESDTLVSSNLSFEYTPTADVTLTAKYTANAKMTVNINGGTSYSVSVNGGTASDYSTSTSPSYEVGTKLTVTAKGENFAYWQNEASSVLSRSAEYTFTVVNGATVTAVYDTKVDSKAIVNFISGYDQIINRYQITAAEDFTVPAAPTKTGCDFAGWSINGTVVALTAEGYNDAVKTAVQAAITAALATKEDTTDDIINVKATYTAKDQKVTVTVNSGSGSGEYNVNDVVTVTADPPAENMKFSHWTDGTNILSYNTSYSFYAAKNITVEAVYVEEAATVTAVGTTEIVDVIKDTTNGKISFVSMSTVPEGCTIVKAGIVATSDATVGTSGDGFNDTTAAKVRGDSWSGNSYSFTFTIKTQKTYYVRAYLVYTDKNGNSHTIYGDMVSANVNE